MMLPMVISQHLLGCQFSSWVTPDSVALIPRLRACVEGKGHAACFTSQRKHVSLGVSPIAWSDRATLLEFQRSFAKETVPGFHGAVLDGRDIGSTVSTLTWTCRHTHVPHR